MDAAIERAADEAGGEGRSIFDTAASRRGALAGFRSAASAPGAVSSDRCLLGSGGAERFGSGAGACRVLFVGPAADADRADDLICVPQRYAAGEDHDAAIVRCVDAEERRARLAEATELGCLYIKGSRCPGLVDGDVDGADARVVHAGVRDEVAADVDDGDVHWAADGLGFGLGGFDDTPGSFEIDGGHLSAAFRKKRQSSV